MRATSRPRSSSWMASYGASRGRMAWAALCALVASCGPPPEPSITLQVGPNQVLSFEPRAAFAHYYELPGHEDVLRIVLASYPVSCQRFLPPGPGEVYVSVTVFAPPTTTIEPGAYPWQGLPSDDEEEDAEPQAKALPFVRLAQEGRTLPPGGLLKINAFKKEPLGLLEGQLAFRDGGDQQASTAALMGDFSLRLCHGDFDPARAAKDEQ